MVACEHVVSSSLINMQSALFEANSPRFVHPNPLWRHPHHGAPFPELFPPKSRTYPADSASGAKQENPAHTKVAD